MITRAALVYQAGLANVFQVDSFNLSDYGREAKRLMQGAFTSCEMVARGLEIGGTIIRSFHCNQAGDITHARWDADLSNAPFRASMAQVNTN